MEKVKIGLTSEQYRHFFNRAISYDVYLENFQNEINLGDKSPYARYLPQNWSRQSRLDRKFKLREDLALALSQNDQHINWLVITEHWCGDASQINPILTKAAEASQGKINLKYIYRDENEALMNAHLTDGRSKSIPILIQLDEAFNFVKSYGPRPAEAQKLVKELLAKEESYIIPVHTWYAKNKQQDLQDDLVRLIEG